MDEQIDSCDWLFLRELSHPVKYPVCKALRIVVAEGKSKNLPQPVELTPGGRIIPGVRIVDVDESCRVFEVFWRSYVALSVWRETEVVLDEAEQREGKLFRQYTRSRFLDYIAQVTGTPNAGLRGLKHWELVCFDQLVEVASTATPVVRQIGPA
jgi:hypothetical protein